MMLIMTYANENYVSRNINSCNQSLNLTKWTLKTIINSTYLNKKDSEVKDVDQRISNLDKNFAIPLKIVWDQIQSTILGWFKFLLDFLG